MAKKDEEKRQQENEAYKENYEKQIRRLYFLSRFNSRQFLGTRTEGDPRVEYLAALESFKNLANAQIAGVVRALTMLLGDKKQEFLDIMAEELANVSGVEEIEITDPNQFCGHRKMLDKSLLRAMKGQELSAPVLRQKFGYSQTTWLEDTQLKKYIEPVVIGKKRLWRVK